MQAIALIKTFISFVGMKVAVALNVAAGAQATMAIGSAVIAGTALVAKKAMSLFEVDMAMPDTDRTRQSTVKSATEPQKSFTAKRWCLARSVSLVWAAQIMRTCTRLSFSQGIK